MSLLWEIAITISQIYIMLPSVSPIASRCTIPPWKYINVWQLLILRPTILI